MKFVVKPHLVRPGAEVVDVFDDMDNFLATIVQGDDGSQVLKIVSRRIRASVMTEGTPATVEISLDAPSSAPETE